MTWYQAGTVTLTNGSTQVDGAGTDFLPPNVVVGDGFADENGVVYEIAGITSSTRLTISPAYRAASGGGRLYKIIPTPDYQRLLAMRALDLLNDFGAVRDGIGKGLIADGSEVSPGLRFANDQDTGIFRFGENQLGLVAGGVRRVAVTISGMVVTGNTELYADEFPILAYGRNGIGTWYSGGYQAGQNSWNLRFNALAPAISVTNDGNVGIGIGAPQTALHLQRTGICELRVSSAGVTAAKFLAGPNFCSLGTVTTDPVVFVVGDTERARFDNSGNLLVGIAAGSEHTITKSAGQGSAVLRVRSSAAGALDSLVVASVSNYSVNGAGAAVYIGKSTATDRSANLAGTINANGADYAEYMTKAPGCGTIEKGDVCGVDRQGLITRTWADAIMFKIKSTDPNLVGGDTWAAHLGPRPNEPVLTLPAYDGPAAPEESEADHGHYARDRAAYDAAQAAYAILVASAEAEHATALTQYRVDLLAFETALEEARRTVDRIAYCGRVPVNFAEPCQPGDYLVAIANGGGIGLKAVAEADITFADYRRRVGRVLSIGADGRPIVDVMQG